MGRDFYLDDFALAAYVEKDWFDHVVRSGTARPGRFAFAPFDLAELYSPYHEKFVDLIAGDPVRVLEIGAGTGRTFYELARRSRRLRAATLVEPSRKLCDVFKRLTTGRAVEYVPVLKGNGEIVEVALNTSEIRAAIAGIDVTLVNRPFAEVPDPGQFDLVVCSNVIDQCHEPLRLIEMLRRATAPGGTLALSCTYQWQSKYKGLPTAPIRHLDELFGADWRLVNEADVPFRVRVNERHWMTFLSHVGVFRRETAGDRG